MIDKPTEPKRGVSGSSLSYYINIIDISNTDISDHLWGAISDNVTVHLCAAISDNMRAQVTNSITNSIRNNVYVECREYWI